MTTAIMDYILKAEIPVTIEHLMEKLSLDQNVVEEELERLTAANQLHKRSFSCSDGVSKSVYWASNIITFSNQESVITTPFTPPFDYNEASERLTDAQLAQEKAWLQNRLRKLNSEYENTKHLSSITINPDDETKLETLTKKWLASSQELLEALHKKLQESNPDLTMNRLIQQNKIDPNLIKWDPEQEQFNSV